MSQPRQPTVDECSNHTEIEPGRFAIWYPQMGGYVGRAVIEQDDGGFNAWVWHDGEFPFEDGFEPRMLYHSEAAQFIRFGQDVEELLGLDGEVIWDDQAAEDTAQLGRRLESVASQTWDGTIDLSGSAQ